MKKISILLSCFNATQLIESYVSSILSPNITSISTLIVIDFPFSHQNPSFVKQQLQRYPDLVYIPKAENISLYDAWNEAIELASTEFVSNLNLDDRVTPEYYQQAIAALTERSADVFSSFSVATSKIGIISDDAHVQQQIPIELFNGDELFQYELKDMVIEKNGRILKRNIPHCAPVWRRSLHKELGYFESKKFDFCADYEFWLRVVAAGKRMIISQKQQTIFYSANNTVSDKLIHSENHVILDRWSHSFPPKNYKPTHLGENHDFLHHCLNMNAIFSSPKYHVHLKHLNQIDSSIAPQISIIMPAFNPGKFIDEAIQSIQKQSVTDWELIIIDDGCTDNSIKIAERASKADNRIKIIRNKRTKGVSGARNTGIDLARGEFIAFLDADDVLYEEALKYRLNAFENDLNLQMVHSFVDFTDEFSNKLDINLSVKGLIDFYSCYGNFSHLNAILMRKKYLINIRFEETIRNGEDWLFLSSILRSGIKSEFVKNGGATYRIHPSSSVVKNFKKHEETLLYVIDWLYTPLHEPWVKTEYQKGLTTPPKQIVLQKRKASLFIWMLLANDKQECLNILSDLDFQNFMRTQSKSYFISTLKIPLARQYMISLGNLDKLPHHVVHDIRLLINEINIKKHIPNLYSALFDLFKFKQTTALHYLTEEFTRKQLAHLDETQIIHEIFRTVLNGSVMIDIGAHFGSSLLPFLKFNWKIFAFEPDEQNRQKLLQRLSNHPHASNVKLDTRAVSDKSQKGLTFYRSKESTGTSGLSAFLSSHIAAQTVDVITLTEVLAHEDIEAVDFLKIDTEGHDLFVLKGFPWERFKPAVIECEFEDSKTVPLGYTFHDLASYLVDKGYSVYVSEWHPIIRYGIRHDWRQLSRYPSELADEKGWGNLLAFRDGIDENKLIEAVHSVLKFGKPQPVWTKKTTSSISKMFIANSPLIQKPLEPVIQFSRISSSSDFVELSKNHWQYRKYSEKQSFWSAVFEVKGDIQDKSLTAYLCLQASEHATVRVSLGRHSTENYEGNHQTVHLSPNEKQTIKVDKTFSKNYSALNIQLEVLEIENNDQVDLMIDLFSIDILPLAKIRQRTIDSDNIKITLANANTLFRQGSYSAALDIYILLYVKYPLRIYADNALICGHKLGLKSISTLDELLQHI